MSAHMQMILSLPCVLCARLGVKQESRTYGHHIRHGEGMAQRAPDELAIPLCYECHQGPNGIHGDRSRWSIARMDELDALAMTIRAFTVRAPEFEEPYEDPRTQQQNRKMWASLRDIARQVPWPVSGKAAYQSEQDWKDILTAGLRHEQRVALGIEGGFVLLGERTKRMSKKRMRELIDLLILFGDAHEVAWTDPDWISQQRTAEAHA
jgi:hypothetical protein